MRLQIEKRSGPMMEEEIFEGQGEEEKSRDIEQHRNCYELLQLERYLGSKIQNDYFIVSYLQQTELDIMFKEHDLLKTNK